VDGFYDGIQKLSEDEKSKIDFSFDPKQLKDAFDLDCTGGERSLNPLESAWLRPTLEINGIAGGYAGAGFKTVIPSKAIAKISGRLCPGQDPEKVGKSLGEHLVKNAPPGIRVNFDLHAGTGRGVISSPNSRIVESSKQAISKIMGKDCSIILDGASIPIAPNLRAAAGADISYIGYMLPDDYLHAPDEHFGVDRMELGLLTIYEILDNLSA